MQHLLRRSVYLLQLRGTMKSALIFVTTIIIISCKSSDEAKKINYDNYIDKEIYLVGRDSNWDLQDSLGSISLKIPKRLDTSYNWEDPSDCSSCGWMKYRFADQNYSQFAERSIWTFVPDSVYQLNIWHNPIKEVPDSIILKPLREKDTANWYYYPHILSYSDSTSFLIKKFEIINGRSFIISAFISPHGYLTESQTLFVVAETTLKSRELYFIGECGAKDTTGFVDNMYKSFLSIKIEEKR
jgi:hypothetical protein